MKYIIDSTLWSRLATLARDWTKVARVSIEYSNGAVMITIAPSKSAARRKKGS